MAQILRHNPALTLGLCLGMLALSGCNVFGREINNGIWFPILIVVGFIVFAVWYFRRRSSRRHANGRTTASGWTDGGDASGHGGHTYMDDGADDGGGGHNG